MQTSAIPAGFVRVSRQTINRKQYDVLANPEGNRTYVRDHGTLITADAAKALKSGPYPLHGDLERVVSAARLGESPLAARSSDLQLDAARTILDGILSRIETSGAEFSFDISEN